VSESRPSSKPDLSEFEKSARQAKVAYRQSTVRESLVEHMFLAEIMQEAWINREQVVEVLKADVDAFGYDLVLECNGILRHVQLKTSEATGKTSQQTINIALAEKEKACVVWVVLDRDSERGRFKMAYRYFGGQKPDDPMPTLGDVVGVNPLSKRPRDNTRIVKKNRFDRIETMAQLLDRMFGAPSSQFD
jgi:hypothetical protein